MPLRLYFPGSKVGQIHLYSTCFGYLMAVVWHTIIPELGD
jgi:hypothetical protein